MINYRQRRKVQLLTTEFKKGSNDGGWWKGLAQKVNRRIKEERFMLKEEIIGLYSHFDVLFQERLSFDDKKIQIIWYWYNKKISWKKSKVYRVIHKKYYF